MGGDSFIEIELLGDWNLQLRVFDRAIEALEFAGAGRAVVTLDADSLALARLRLDAVRIRRPPALPQRIETAGQLLAAGECQNRVDAFGREISGGFENIIAFAVDGLVSAETADEIDAVCSRRRGQDARAAQFRELQREHPDIPARAVDDHLLAARDLH